MSCHVISCYVMSCHVIILTRSGHVMQYDVMSCYVMSYLMMSYHVVMSSHGILWMSCDVMSCHIMWWCHVCHVMWCHVMSSDVILLWHFLSVSFFDQTLSFFHFFFFFANYLFLSFFNICQTIFFIFFPNVADTPPPQEVMSILKTCGGSRGWRGSPHTLPSCIFFPHHFYLRHLYVGPLPMKILDPPMQDSFLIKYIWRHPFSCSQFWLHFSVLSLWWQLLPYS